MSRRAGATATPACQLRSAETLLACQQQARHYPAFKHPTGKEEKEAVLRAAWEIRLQIGVAARKWFQAQSTSSAVLPSGARDRRAPGPGQTSPDSTVSGVSPSKSQTKQVEQGVSIGNGDSEGRLLSEILEQEADADLGELENSGEVMRQLSLSHAADRSSDDDDNDDDDDDGAVNGEGYSGGEVNGSAHTPPRNNRVASESRYVGNSPCSPGMEFTAGVPFSLLQDGSGEDDDDTEAWGKTPYTAPPKSQGNSHTRPRSGEIEGLLRRLDHMESQLQEEREARTRAEQHSQRSVESRLEAQAAKISALEEQVKALVRSHEKVVAAANQPLVSDYQDALSQSEGKRTHSPSPSGTQHVSLEQLEDMEDNSVVAVQNDDDDDDDDDDVDDVDGDVGAQAPGSAAPTAPRGDDHTTLQHVTASRASAKKSKKKKKKKAKKVDQETNSRVEDNSANTATATATASAPVEPDYDIHEEF